MNQDDIILRHAVVHILDQQVGMPVLSDKELEQNEELNAFIRKHIYRIFSSDDMKQCVFYEEEAPEEETQEGFHFYSLVKQFSEEKLVDFSKKAAVGLYAIMRQYIDIPAADFMTVTYQYQSKLYLALLKLNYKEGYIHQTYHEEDSNDYYNHIFLQRTLLPSSKLSEAVIIDLSDYSVRIVEKKYEINGEKENYLSERYLKCHAKMSSKSKMAVVSKAVEQINKKYYPDSVEKTIESKNAIIQDIQQTGSVHVEEISEKLYGNVPEIRQEFEEKLDKYHMKEAQVEPQSESTYKKFQKQYLKTDTGIEINIPMEQFEHPENVEFITNPDGTISVLIKNINHLTSR